MSEEDKNFGRRIADGRAVGELIGELRQVTQRLGTMEIAIQDLRKTNAQDHAAVVQQLTSMGERIATELDRKADKADVVALTTRKEEHQLEQDHRLIELEGWRREQQGGRGPTRTAQWVIGLLGAAVVALVTTLITLIASGHHP